jgi:RHS repeat-associated protein
MTSYQFDPALEIVDGAVVLSYYFAGKRVARPVGSEPLELLVSDHLGSLRLVTTSTAETAHRLTYQPWGVATYVLGSSTEKYKYNGNAEDVPGLYDYNARTYTPKWRAMLQADSVVPSYGRSQSSIRSTRSELRPNFSPGPSLHDPTAARCHRATW